MVARTATGKFKKIMTGDGRRRPLKREIDDLDRTIDQMTNF